MARTLDARLQKLESAIRRQTGDVRGMTDEQFVATCKCARALRQAMSDGTRRALVERIRTDATTDEDALLLAALPADALDVMAMTAAEYVCCVQYLDDKV